MQSLDPIEFMRYTRHFPIIGIEAQKQLKSAKVLCIGAGGLGSPALQYLAASGTGTLGIMDGDQVELSNLQRQILFNESDIGMKKAEVIAKRLRAMNSYVTVNVYPEFFLEKYQALLAEYDVIIDATDNYEARYLLNHISRKEKKPLVSASIYQFSGQISVFNYQEGPCYQCLYPEPPPQELTPNCAESGVLGVLPGVLGTLQATETMKIILGKETLSGTLLCLNLLTMNFQKFSIPRQHCANHPVVFANPIKSQDSTFNVIMPSQLQDLIAAKKTLQVIDVREAYEREICHLGGEHVPLGELEKELPRFNKNQMTIIYCRSGSRSALACKILLSAGFEDVHNLEGGILKWQETVDQHLTRY